MKIRGSKADLAMACAGSLVATDTPYNPHSDEAREGSAKHAALAYLPRGEEPPVAEIAARFDVDADEIARAVSYGRQAWAELGRYVPGAKTEQKLEGPVTVGTADILGLAQLQADGHADETVHLAILDWKTGWSYDEHGYQLLSYADAAREVHGMPTSGYVTGIEVWLRHREYRIRNFTEPELDGFRERAKRQLELVGRQYAAGGHCKFCPRQNACPARDEYLRASVTALVPADAEPKAITREVLGQLYERSKVIAKALRAYEQLLDAALKDGPIPLGAGRALALEPVEQDEIKAVVAESVLRDKLGWGDAELAEVLGATKSGLERVIKARVAKGGAAAEMRRVLGALREAGAIAKIEKHQKKVIDL